LPIKGKRKAESFAVGAPTADHAQALLDSAQQQQLEENQPVRAGLLQGSYEFNAAVPAMPAPTTATATATADYAWQPQQAAMPAGSGYVPPYGGQIEGTQYN
jgi:hypothetical protein